jgi:Na+-driven multidrug efflux pump
VPVAYLFARFFGIGKVWYSMWISETVAVIYVIWATKKEMDSCGINKK